MEKSTTEGKKEKKVEKNQEAVQEIAAQDVATQDVASQEIATFDKYAIFKTGGKQYQAVKGRTIAIEKIEGEPGEKLEFDKVLLRRLGGEKIEIGQPYLESKIKASIVKQTKGPKLIVFRFKRRKKYRVKKGHRQSLTVVRIESI
ncbi:50S ribosomal protein L21 [Candidatus Dependentiae bacterium]